MKAKWFWLAYQKFILLIIMMEQCAVYGLADFWCCHVVFSVWDVVCLFARALFDIDYCWLEFRPDASWILVQYDGEGTEHGIMLHAWCS